MNLINPYNKANTTLTPFQEAIISAWNCDGNSNDRVGTNNGSDTNVNYAAGGIIGNSVNFSLGTDSNVEISDDDSLSFPTGEFSYSCWVYYDAVGNSTLLSKTNGASISEYDLIVSGGKLYCRLFSGGTQTNHFRIIYTWSISSLTWYNVTFTWDGSNTISGLKLYINKTLVGSGSEVGTFVSMSNTSAPLMFGRTKGLTTFSLNGKMDEIYLFNKELTPTEVDFCYDEGIAGRPLI